MPAPTPLTAEERLSRLEGVYDHLATKADVVRLEGEIKGEIAGLKTELYKGLNRNLYITIGAIAVVVALVKYLP